MQSQVDGGINSTHLFGTLRKGTYGYNQKETTDKHTTVQLLATFHRHETDY